MENEATEEDFKQLMDELANQHPQGKEGFERDQKFWDLISPYMGMTEEEMIAEIPHGFYELSGGGFVAITGKTGLINCILSMQKEIKKLQ